MLINDNYYNELNLKLNFKLWAMNRLTLVNSIRQMAMQGWERALNTL